MNVAPQPAESAASAREPVRNLDARRRTHICVLVIALLGLSLFVAHHRLPVLRNGMVYARTALNLVDNNFNLGRVGSDSKLSYYKPLGFPLLGAVFVPLLGPNSAMVFASFLGGLVLLFVSLGFFRHFNRRLGIDERYTWLELTLVFFNPLVLYQFWSAYPDALFAGLFVLFFWQLDRFLQDRDSSALRIPVTYGVLYLTVVVKQYGLVLLPLHALYLVANWRVFRDHVLRHRRRRWSFFGSIAVLGLLLAAAPLGWNPTLYVSTSGGGVTHYFGGLAKLLGADEGQPEDDEAEEASASKPFSRTHATRQALVVDNLNQLTVFFVVVFNVALLLALNRNNLNRVSAGLVLVSLTYILGLLMYKYAWFNMRFYIPVAPALALFIVNGFRQLQWRRLATAPLAISLLFNAVTTFNYNTRTGQEVFATFNAAVIPYSTPPRQFPYFTIDCLRAYWHIQRQLQFDHINKTLPPGATLFFSHAYYRGVSKGVYTTPGLLIPGAFRPDIKFEFYRRESEIPWTTRPECFKDDHPCYKYRATKFRLPRPVPRGPSADEPWFVDVAWGLYQIVPEQREARRPVRQQPITP